MSVTDRAGEEWLAQPVADFALYASETRFADAEMCGWDEIGPTMRSVGRADHGVLWTAAWTVCAASDESITVLFEGDGFALTRTTSLTPGGFDLHYCARATGADMPFLWMAHPQFRADSRTRLSLEPRPRQCARDVDGKLVDEAWTPERAQLSAVPEGAGQKTWFSGG